MRPIAARTHEPAGYVIRESRDAIHVLEMFYLLTGDLRYLKPVPGCLAWYERVNREAIDLKRPPARYWEPGTNLPIYVVQTPARNAEGYGLFKWTTTPESGMEVRQAVDVGPIRQEFETIAGLTTADGRARHYERHFGARPSSTDATPVEVARIISARGDRVRHTRSEGAVLNTYEAFDAYVRKTAREYTSPVRVTLLATESRRP